MIVALMRAIGPSVLIETYYSMSFRFAGWTRTPSLLRHMISGLVQSNQLIHIIFLILVLIGLVTTKTQHNRVLFNSS
jgi:uncharacterized phage infection (PIP) family protein YhgE